MGVASGVGAGERIEGGEEGSAGNSTYLGNQSLEETTEALVLGHVAQNSEAALGVVKVAVLDSRLDDIEGGGNDERGRGTGNGSNEVLEPSRLVVVLEVEEPLLGKGRTTKQLPRVSKTHIRGSQWALTAKEPGALRAAVQPQPR